jgi:hypothetical protein
MDHRDKEEGREHEEHRVTHEMNMRWADSM